MEETDNVKKLKGLFALVFPFPFFLGIAAAAAIYLVGSMSILPTQKAEEQELTILVRKVAQAYLISEKSPNPYLKEETLRLALDEATRHPQIISASIRSNNNQVLGIAQKNPGKPYFKLTNFEYPILNAEGQPLAQVHFELNPDANEATQNLKVKINWLTLLAFLIGGAIPFLFRKKTGAVEPEFFEAIKQVGQGNYEVSLPPTFRSQNEDLVQAFNNMLEGLHERDRMKHSLGRIMDPKIAEALIKEDPKLGGRIRQATILFCDMRNYTSICEELGPEELQEFLNEYWRGTVEIIMEQEGTIDKFHGDGVCVVYGAPMLHADDPLRAVRTAWRLVANVAALNERRQAQRKVPIQIGIGIHLGEVIAGHIGSERRMDYTVVGDVVNVAERIEELNKKFGTHVLISDSVYEQVEPFVRVKTLTLAHLRGHKKPILVHALKEFHDVPEDIRNQKGT